MWLHFCEVRSPPQGALFSLQTPRPPGLLLSTSALLGFESLLTLWSENSLCEPTEAGDGTCRFIFIFQTSEL